MEKTYPKEGESILFCSEYEWHVGTCESDPCLLKMIWKDDYSDKVFADDKVTSWRPLPEVSKEKAVMSMPVVYGMEIRQDLRTGELYIKAGLDEPEMSEVVDPKMAEMLKDMITMFIRYTRWE